MVDPDLGQIRVTRIVGAYGVGNILNAKTARSQLLGGIVFGIGMALLEETVVDPRIGRVMNADLAEYHVPVNADIPDIDITFVPETDPYVNPLGVKGIGEIGITGVVRRHRQRRLPRHRQARPRPARAPGQDSLRYARGGGRCRRPHPGRG